MKKPTSFSQNNMFDKCPRQWYYSYILKIPAVQDFTYANAGTVIHKTLEIYYSGVCSNTDALKAQFKLLWKKYKLDNSILKDKEDLYWLMVINGINLNIPLTSREMKIFYPDVVGYLDGVNTKDDIILDWKSSTRRPDNEEEYKKQLMFYAYLYKRKFDRLPNRVTAYYLKYTGSKGELSFEPTESDIIRAEEWHLTQRMNMQRIIMHGQTPPKCEGECNPWCPYTNLCESEGSQLKYTLNLENNYIHIDGPITELLNRGLLRKFSYELKNAYFMKKANPHARTTVNFWDSKNRKLPIGFLEGLKKTLNDYAEYKKKDININIVDKRKFNIDRVNMPDKFLNDVELRNYQRDAVDKFLKKKTGMLELGTGAGKSYIMTEIIRHLGMKTLILVNRVELLRQLKDTIEESLGIEVGIIGQSEDNIKDITIGTIQTIYKNINRYSNYLKTVRLSIMDEAHNVNHNSYWRTSQHFINTEYRLGLTGTPYRSDGNDMFLNAVNGYVIYQMNADKLIQEGWLVKPTIYFIKDFITKEEKKQLEADSKTGLINETEQYNDVYRSFIVNNNNRNNLIKNLLLKHNNKKVLILVKLIKHGEYLSNLLNIKYLKGSTPKEERKQLMKDFKEGKINALIGTISIFAEGLDIPTLNILINASAQKSDIKSIQTLGRLLRKIEGKEGCIYYDFVDEGRLMGGASRSRMRAFRNENHNVYIVESNNIFTQNEKTK